MEASSVNVFFMEKIMLMTNFSSKLDEILSVWDENHIIKKLFARSIEWKPLNLMYFFMTNCVSGEFLIKNK